MTPSIDSRSVMGGLDRLEIDNSAVVNLSGRRLSERLAWTCFVSRVAPSSDVIACLRDGMATVCCDLFGVSIAMIIADGDSLGFLALRCAYMLIEASDSLDVSERSLIAIAVVIVFDSGHALMSSRTVSVEELTGILDMLAECIVDKSDSCLSSLSSSPLINFPIKN